jgi:iron complex outermembrane receptor protein
MLTKLIAGGLLLILPFCGALAQDSVLARVDSLHVVVVTGIRGAVLLRETPLAMVAVSSKKLLTTIEPNIVDALVLHVPGLNAVKTGPNISKPFIRGLGYNRVLTLYDGIRQEGQQWGDEHGIEVDAYGIERAEVIKGPASLLYGSDALGGVVSLFPAVPSEKDEKIHGRWLSEYQSNNGLAGNGLRLYSSKERWLWSMNGSYRIAKNYNNPVDGRVYNTGFRETNVGFGAGYNLKDGQIRVHATLYDNLQGIPDGSRDSLTRRFTKQTDEASTDILDQRPVVSQQELNSYALSPLHQHIQHYRIYTLVRKGRTETLLALQQNIRREYNHPMEVQQPGLFVRLNTLNYGFKYMAPRWNDIDITAGINGMYQGNRSKKATDFPIPDYHSIDGGLYLYGRWKFRQLTVSGGMRYDVRQLDIRDFYTRTKSVTGFSSHVSFPDTVGARLQFPALHKTFTGLSTSLGMAWQLTEQITLKANLSSGYRSPSITEIASNGLDPGAHIIYLGNRSFVPEISWQQDIGIEGQFPDWNLTLSLFNNQIQHYIYLSQLADGAGDPVTDAQGNKTFQYRQAAAHLYGLEASVAFHPAGLKGFTVENAVALVYGINKKQEYAHAGIRGEFLPFIPPLRWTGNMQQVVKLSTALSVSMRAGVEFNAAQNRYLALYNTETATPAYTLLHVGAGADIRLSPGLVVQWQVQIDNLLNTAYQSNLSRLKYFEYYNQSPNGHLGIYSMGRSINTRITIPF